MAKLLFIFLSGFLLILGHIYCQAAPLSLSDSTHKVFYENQKKGIKNGKGEVLLPAKYDDFGWSDNKRHKETNLLGYKKDKFWGLLDVNLNAVTSPKYNSLVPINDEYYIASILGKYSQTNFYGVISAEGNVKVEFTYRNLLPAGNYIIAATKQEKNIQFGLIDTNGKKILDFNYFRIKYLGKEKFEITDNEGITSLYNIDRKPDLLYADLDSVSKFNNGVAIIYKQGRQGLITEDGRILLPIKYKQIEWSDNSIYVTPLDEWQIINDGKTIHTNLADSVSFLNDSLLVKNIGHYSEILNLNNDKIIAMHSGSFLGVFANYFIIKENQSVQLIHRDTALISLSFSPNVYWNENYFIAEKKGFSGVKYEILNKKGKKLVADTFKFLPNTVAVGKGDFWSVFDRDFIEIIPSLYSSVEATDTTQFIVQFQNSYGVVNQNNDWVIPPSYLSIEEIGKGIYLGVNKYLHEFILTGNHNVESKLYYDLHGKHIIEKDIDNNIRLVNNKGNALTEYMKGRYAGHSEEGILIRNGEQIKLYTTSGNKQFQIKGYDSVLLSKDEFIPIKKSGSYGFIDQQGLLRIANRYDSVASFSEDMAAVKIRSGWGFIDRREVLRVQPYFTKVSDFKNGLSVVKYKGKFGVIDKTGNYKIEATYDEILFSNSMFLLRKNNQWGVANAAAKVILYPGYEEISLAGNYIIVKKYSKHKVLDKQGNPALNHQFDEIIYNTERNLFIGASKAKRKQVFLTDLLKGKTP
ncbi:hypothetical protein GCM10011506_31380 [Marivirga lumbricoides]|uniref:WG repeat-containing protein n=1 Tax=Marivirga lumbricoides TaxID=1046115 RepID=A0ABQ1MRJ0_9BACT|nr:hypothetical protein GCM10011506_31380 [Marivirga lumbricoides]